MKVVVMNDWFPFLGRFLVGEYMHYCAFAMHYYALPLVKLRRLDLELETCCRTNKTKSNLVLFKRLL